ncbi:MAG: hypothetical protein K8T26_09565 [Lentisphaerae bacterium]|nr:hypothetical protein [Lentisphaerota bacterium]
MAKAPAHTAEQLIFSSHTLDLKEFEAGARNAKAAGFTHVDISWMDGLTDFQGVDKDSPWCQWSLISPSLFKHVTPPGLEGAYPAAFVKRQMAWMKKKHAIVAKLGMKAAYYGNEPHWLPQSVYDKHPEWRGSRCDNSLRTVGLFFSPNMDHPEVRQAYRTAVKMLVKACPLLDTFFLMDNDSGSGFNWGGRLYVNPNGPTMNESMDMGKRVIEWMRAMRQGAIDGGVKFPRFFQLCWLTRTEEYLVKRSVEPGLGMINKYPDNPDLVSECVLSTCGTWGGHGAWWPMVLDYPTPLSVVGGVNAIKTSAVKRFYAYGESPRYFPALAAAMREEPATSERQKIHVLGKIAEATYGVTDTDDVVDAWMLMDKAETIAGGGGAHIPHSHDHLRWLVRPFVAHQELLTAEERSYWEPFLYQSKKAQPDSYLDYLNHSGYKIVETWEGATVKACCIDQVEGTLKAAVAKLEAARDKAPTKASRDAIQKDIYRVRVMRSLFLTNRHYLQLGTLIYERDAMARQLAARGEVMTSTRPERPDLPIGNAGSNGLFFMHRAMRWELDNTNELIKILEEAKFPIILTARNKAEECAFLIGPDLIDQLKKKVQITLKHWRDAEIGWYRPTLGG